MVSRRSMLIALPAAFGWRGLLGSLSAVAVSGSKRIAVVFPSTLDPCTEAVEGLRARLSGEGVTLDLLDVNRATFATEVTQELALKPSVIVAVGSDALRAMLTRTSPAITVSTMTLEADGASVPQTGRVHAGVYLDIPMRTLLAELRELFPDKARVGVIRNPSRGDPTAAQIRSQGAEVAALEIADCARPEQLLPVFLSLRKRADFVICLPDGALYNGATARPLIMPAASSIRGFMCR